MPGHFSLGTKFIYGIIITFLLGLYSSMSADLSFKFLLTSVGILGYIILFAHVALQKQSPVLFVSMLLFSLLIVIDLAFIVSGIFHLNQLFLTHDDIRESIVLVYMLGCSVVFYLVVTFGKGWHTPGEQRITRLFIGLLSSVLIIEDVISLSLSGFSSILLALFLLFIYADFVRVSIQSIYPGEE